MSKIYKLLNPDTRFLILKKYGLYNWMSDRLFLERYYKATMNRKLDLDNPKSFNEKLQWLKLYDRNPIYTTLVDKYAVKQYVANIIGKEYIIPTYGVWNHFDEIDFNQLPNQFVLKCTHDSGGLVIVKDKNNFDRKAAKKKIEKSLRRNYYYLGREWPYKNVTPRIIAEQYMEDIETGELRDYKFFCFNGQARCYKVDFDRFIEHRANYYDMENNLLKFGEVVCPPDFDRIIEIPETIEKMKGLAEKLAGREPFMRADFYDVNGKIYFGELTFFPASGFGPFIPEEWDLKLGEWLNIGGGGGMSAIRIDDIIITFQSKERNLFDYKLFCFDGKVKYVYVSDSQKHLIQFYDEDFTPLDIKRADYKDFTYIPSKPAHFEEMKHLAEILSRGVPHVRVDFYEINNQVYFGELTFFTASGFLPFENHEWDEKLGDEIKLDSISRSTEVINEHNHRRGFSTDKSK